MKRMVTGYQRFFPAFHRVFLSGSTRLFTIAPSAS